MPTDFRNTNALDAAWDEILARCCISWIFACFAVFILFEQVEGGNAFWHCGLRGSVDYHVDLRILFIELEINRRQKRLNKAKDNLHSASTSKAN